VVVVSGQAREVCIQCMGVPLQTIHVKAIGVGLAQMRMQKRSEREQAQQHDGAESTQPKIEMQALHRKNYRSSQMSACCQVLVSDRFSLGTQGRKLLMLFLSQGGMP
jgi:hypothetical protein